MRNKLKSYVIGTRIEPIVRRLLSMKASPQFETSGQYWDQRYQLGGNSGAGSYGRLALFKADILNDIVAQNGIKTVIEFGCGDGHQLSLAAYPEYTGVDVSQSAVEACRQRFAGDNSKRFHHTSEFPGDRADLTLSLDVIYHLVEDEIFHQYMVDLFELSTQHVIVYASNKDELTLNPHVKHRRFTDWVETNRPSFSLIKHYPNKYPFDAKDVDNTSFADFYHFSKI